MFGLAKWCVTVISTVYMECLFFPVSLGTLGSEEENSGGRSKKGAMSSLTWKSV